MNRIPKPRACCICKTEFVPSDSFIDWCSVDCGLKKALHKLAVRKARESQKERKVKRAKLEGMKTIPQLKREAQAAFNRFIRERDKGKPCISCRRRLTLPDGKGGSYDAGHYRSTGSADHLRFNEDNCHGQCKFCNQYGAGRAVDYRIGLIERKGVDCVEALESNNEVVKWTREKLLEIKAEYQRKYKELARGHDD